MRLSFNRNRSIRASRVLQAVTVDALEGRRMLSGEGLQTTIAPILADTTTPTNNSITLNQHFFDPAEPGTIVEFNTSYGIIDVGLTDAATPNTVANFLSYVNSGAYDNSIFHRSSDLATGADASPSDPGSIIQAGGYNVANGTVNTITANGNVNDEYTSELYGDVAGTIAMAKTSYADSANSEFYFNVTDNTFLDTPTTDPNGATTSYTVFGKVLDGTSILSTIAALPTDSGLSGSLSGSPVPLANLTAAQVSAGADVTFNDLVYINTAQSFTGTVYNVSSDNKALVTPTVSDGVLSFTYGAGSGVADITVTATNLFDNTVASSTFAVTVPNPSTPTAGPVANPFTAPATVTGTTGTFSVLGPDTDSVAALNPASVTILTQPAHGTATVSVTNGFISYTPDAGYTGPDSLTYTVADTNGTVSAPGTVTLYAAPTAVAVTIASGQTLTYKQPDGVTARATVTGGHATITFTDYQVTVKPVKGGYVASGAGADVASIVITNTNAATEASMHISSTGLINLGSVTNSGRMISFIAPSATLIGAMSLGGLLSLTLGGITGTSVSILDNGTTRLPVNVIVPYVTNSDVNLTSYIGLLRSTRWSITDGQTHTLTCDAINVMNVTQKFDESLSLTPVAGIAMNKATVVDATGTWNLNGTVKVVTFNKPASTWSLSCGYLANATIVGDLTSNIIASEINSLRVTGKTTNAVIQTNGTFDAKFLQIGRLSFAGQVSNSVVYAAGNVGSISAPSMISSRVYAGVALTVAQNGQLAAASTDFTSNAVIKTINLTGRTTAFSNNLISAYDLVAMHLGVLATGNSGTVEGLSASKYGSITANLTPGGRMRAAAAQLKSATTLTAYETKAKLTLGDLQINFI